MSIPLKQLSRTVVFINTAPTEERVALLKPMNQIKDMDDTSEDIFQINLIDRYAARPDELSNLCLAEFAANYRSHSIEHLGDGPGNDVLPLPDDKSDRRCLRIELGNNLATCTSVEEKLLSVFIHSIMKKKLPKSIGPN